MVNLETGFKYRHHLETYIVTGCDLSKAKNAVITIIAYTIYKKAQMDNRCMLNYVNLNIYVKSEIRYRKRLLQQCNIGAWHEDVVNYLNILEEEL